MKKDNGSFLDKIRLRNKALSWVDGNPEILETHGGSGRIYAALYSEFDNGIVFEKDEKKASFLATQRPTWAVYNCDCVKSLEAGASKNNIFNFIDFDPYGEPWPVISAFMDNHVQFADDLVISVTDGLRQKLQLGGAWQVKSIEKIVKKYGNDLYDKYLSLCREILSEKVAVAGYTISHFEGKYVGHNNGMTIYAAKLSRMGGKN